MRAGRTYMPMTLHMLLWPNMGTGGTRKPYSPRIISSSDPATRRGIIVSFLALPTVVTIIQYAVAGTTFINQCKPELVTRSALTHGFNKSDTTDVEHNRRRAALQKIGERRRQYQMPIVRSPPHLYLDTILLRYADDEADEAT